jgi:hypothetical protein
MLPWPVDFKVKDGDDVSTVSILLPALADTSSVGLVRSAEAFHDP